MKFYIVLAIITLIIIQPSYSQVAPTIYTNLQEIKALGEISQHLPGYLIWMSNRDGDWEVYRMDMDAGIIQKLTDNDLPDLSARISPNGKLIAWHQGNFPKQEVWIMNSDGSEKRILVAGASMGEWHNDEIIIIYKGKNNTKTFFYNIQNNTEEQIWPPKRELKARDIRGAKPSPDGKLMIAWSSKPRGTWIFSRDGKFQKHVHGGCEGRFAPDGSFVYWVMTAGTFGRATLKGEVKDPLYKIHETKYGHTYFPRLSRDMKYLVFGSCPNNEHNHDTSDYEIFVMKMNDQHPAWEAPIRLTFDLATDRWPDIFVYTDNTPPSPPFYVETEPHGQQVRITWSGSHDSDTPVRWYKVFRAEGEKSPQYIAKVQIPVYVDRSTMPNSNYYYSISAVNASGLESTRSISAKAMITDSIPQTPSGLYVKQNRDGANIIWSANPEPDVSSYNLYRVQDGIKEINKLNTEPINLPKYKDMTTDMGVKYYYWVKAVDITGAESKASTPVVYIPQESTMPSGILALYLFDEGSGNVVHDRSEIQPLLDLEIRDTNRVRWLNDGVEFTASSMIISYGDAQKLLDNLKSKQEISIEVLFQPSNLNQSGPARIVSMSADSGQRNFTVGQIGKDLALRLRTTKTSVNGSPELDTTRSVLNGQKIHIVTTYNGSIKKLYINGNLHPESQQLTGDFSNWESFPLIIGNELKDDRTWLGKVFMVAIYDRELSAEEVLDRYERN
ncbi:hypothetical protein GF312_00210 [Candidatus Poribacteria bacterium]|nr:hypothetical protein [Candidatus Poribacteria bacterium]